MALAWLGAAASAAGVSASITATYIGMREVMAESGGFCARGGPFEVANECTAGQVDLLVLGLVGVLLFGTLHSVLTAVVDGPKVGLPAICGALMLALGWNFVDLGGDAPGDEGAIAGWLVSGALFWLMGLGFLAPAVSRAIEWARRRGAPEDALFRTAPVRAAAPPAPGAPGSAPPSTQPVLPTRLVVPPGGQGEERS